MATRNKRSVIYILAQSYALEILEALAKKPLRFTDLAAYGPNERTRSQRLKDLEGRGLLTTVSMKMEKRRIEIKSKNSQNKNDVAEHVGRVQACIPRSELGQTHVLYTA